MPNGETTWPSTTTLTEDELGGGAHNLRRFYGLCIASLRPLSGDFVGAQFMQMKSLVGQPSISPSGQINWMLAANRGQLRLRRPAPVRVQSLVWGRRSLNSSGSALDQRQVALRGRPRSPRMRNTRNTGSRAPPRASHQVPAHTQVCVGRERHFWGFSGPASQPASWRQTSCRGSAASSN